MHSQLLPCRAIQFSRSARAGFQFQNIPSHKFTRCLQYWLLISSAAEEFEGCQLLSFYHVLLGYEAVCPQSCVHVYESLKQTILSCAVETQSALALSTCLWDRLEPIMFTVLYKNPNTTDAL